MKNSVFIAEIETLIPRLFTSKEAIEMLYPPEIDGGRPNRFAKRAANAVGITYRPTVLDPDSLPKKVLAKPEYHPKAWGVEIVRKLLKKITKEEVGFLSVAYNIRSDSDFLPSLSGKIAADCGLNLDCPPQETAYLGCAASLFSLESAVKYCEGRDRAAICFVFDQCSWIANPTYDMSSPDFKKNLKSILLFADGAAGLLLIPDSLRDKFNLPLMKIERVKTDFVAGKSLTMSDGKFVLEENLKDTLPEIVSDKIIQPLEITNKNIDEFSLHQGGTPILTRFAEPRILGLNEDQIAPSKAVFKEYGNFSSPSVLFVLEKWFKDKFRAEKDEKIRGAAVSFGAGYFVGGMTYRWSKNSD